MTHIIWYENDYLINKPLYNKCFNLKINIVFSGTKLFSPIFIRPVSKDEISSAQSQGISIFRPWEKSSTVRVNTPKSSNMTTPSPMSSTRRFYYDGSSPVPYSASGWPLYSTPASHQYREYPALQPPMSPVVPGISQHHVTPHHMPSFLSPSSTMSSPVVTAGLGYAGLTTSPVSEADSGYISASPVDMTTSDDVTNSTMNSPYLGNRKYLNPQAVCTVPVSNICTRQLKDMFPKLLFVLYYIYSDFLLCYSYCTH